MNKIVVFFLGFLAMLFVTTSANADCAVKDDGSWKVIGRFQFEYAYRDCLKVFKKYYLRESIDGNAELYLKCRGRRQLIATAVNFEVFTTGMKVAGCVIPKTVG